MRILHVDTEKGLRGGQGQVMHLMRGLRDAGVPQVLAARRGEKLLAAALEEGLDARALWPIPAWAPGAAWQLRGIIDRFAPTLVHAHSAAAHAIALAALPDGVPLVVTRRVDFAPRDKAKYSDRRIHWIAISSGVARVLVDAGVASGRITIVPSGIDPARATSAPTGARMELRRSWGVREPGPVVGFVGAYVDHKDPLNLVEAARAIVEEHPHAIIVLVGEGELRPALEARAAKLGLKDSIVLAGWRNDIAACLSAFDIFVMPSKLEGLCTSLLDAQAAGLPCVATRAGGIPDIIEDKENGTLVPPQDAAALATAVIALWKDEARRLRFAAAGPRRVHDHFTVERMVQGTLEVYREIPRRVVLESMAPAL